jgi:hypothetical protein
MDASPRAIAPDKRKSSLTKAPARSGEDAVRVDLRDTRCCGICRPAKIPSWLPARLPSLPGMSAVLVQGTYSIFTTIVVRALPCADMRARARDGANSTVQKQLVAVCLFVVLTCHAPP